MEGRVAVTVCVTALLVMVDRTANSHPPPVAVSSSCMCMRVCVHVQAAVGKYSIL